jgi:NTP pyrophosphatase (non-canonical NTP hydrolase)
MPGLDNDTKISELKEQVKEFNSARKWEQYHTPKEVAVSISIEAAELLELFQWKALSRSDIKRDQERLIGIQEEVADIMIYIFSLAITLDIDLSSAIINKLDKNARKYPINNK